MPEIHLALALPLAAVAFLAALVAACTLGRWNRRSIRSGRFAWGGLAGFSIIIALGSAGDRQHLIWAVQLPMFGLFASAGLLLVTTRRPSVTPPGGLDCTSEPSPCWRFFPTCFCSCEARGNLQRVRGIA